MAVATARTAAPTPERILDTAEKLVQTRGFKGFSYADVAAHLGITKASLHYHFPGKAELGEALIVRYSTRFAEALARIDADLPDTPAKLEAYVELYAKVLRAKRMCLCGILAAEFETLPGPMRKAVVRFFDDNQAWLAGVLTRGQGEGSLSFRGTAVDAAQSLISGLEGAMLLARPYGDPSRFESAASRLLVSLVG
jgi:TetR/AcrR family transcriptional regulator, transcriptional repressor for nem operon